MGLKGRKVWLLLILFYLTILPTANATDYQTGDFLGAEIYFVDSIKIQDAVIFIDKNSGYELINSKSHISDVKKTSSKNIDKLLADGWALLDTEPTIFFFIENEKLKKIQSKFSYPTDIDVIDSSTEQVLGKYKIYNLSEVPSCYALFLIKGDFFNYLNTGCCLDCLYDKKLKFKNKDAFYPIVIPLYRI